MSLAPRKLLAPTFLVAVVAAAVVGLVLAPHQKSAAQPVFSGSALLGTQAPPFELKDQGGQQVRLAQFLGRPVVLSFMRSHCRETCPVVAESIRHSLESLKGAGRRVAILVISVDPEGDNRTSVLRFSRAHGMVHRWHYLMGSRRDLVRIWRAYAIYAAPYHAARALQDSHTTATYLIDGRGKERVLYGSALDTASLARDLRIVMNLPVEPLGSTAAPAPEVGHPAPDFTLASVNGAQIRLRSLRGKVVLVNFWATWCRPCRQEMPLLARWYRQGKRKGFVVLGVDKQEPAADVQRFLNGLRISYPVVLDSSGSVLTQYHVVPIPTSFLVDRQGVIRSTQFGAVDDRYFKTRIAPLLDR